MTKKDLNPRTCIISRAERDPSELIRFVLDGDGQIVPDINRKLPGRGVWVTSKRSVVEEACVKNGFSRGFRQGVLPDPAIPGLVSDLLARSALNLLAMARKAGVLITGRSKVEELVRSGEAAFVLHAIDASDDGKKKIRNALTGTEPGIAVFDLFTSEDLDRITGGANTMHLAVVGSGIAAKAKTALLRMVSYEEI